MIHDDRTRTPEEVNRVDALALAIRYYSDCAKQRMILPKRDDADLNIELRPTMEELISAARIMEQFITYGVNEAVLDNEPEAGETT